MESTYNGLAVSRPPSDIREEADELESEVVEIIRRHDYERSSLISVLLEIQSEYNYLPKQALKIVSDKLDVSPIQVYSVATFYKVFSLNPRGKHIINVCLGTACHVRGGAKIVDEIERELGIKVGETTEDMLFSLETVRCLGCCASGPVVTVGEEYYSQVTPKAVNKILGRYKGEENT